MATQPTEGKVSAFPAAPPMPAVARILARYDRPQLEAFLSIAIDLLDTMDPDPDGEDDGTAEDSDPAEDDDPDTGVEDGPKGFDPEEDLCLAGDHGGGMFAIHGNLHWGARDEDPGDVEEFSDPDARREHRNRIRQTRCDKIHRPGRYGRRAETEYELKHLPDKSLLGRGTDLL